VLGAARGVAEGDVWVVFQPHTTNRTAALLDDFARAFEGAQHVLVLPIYVPAGRETADGRVSSADLVERIQASGHADARLVHSFGDARGIVGAQARSGDLVLTMGAGDVTRLSDDLVRELAA
jgi:UDP-N-acetylmuramate--alanine ligase